MGYFVLSFQVSAFRSAAGNYFSRDVAALAVSLDVMDAKYITNIYPSVDYVAKFREAFVDGGYSVFGRYPYSSVSNKIGETFDEKSVGDTCFGALDSIEPIDDVQGYVRVQGWLFDKESRTSPRLIRFVDVNKKIVGFALTGMLRSDLPKAIDSKAKLAGYVGYLQKSAAVGPIHAVGENPDCKIIFDVRL